ncbi:DNA helicase [Rhodococcus phage Mbo2]|uniref:DNA helicase n=1 Tax=Rhodococcus phage Mbo2 TaxID=2936911 RepID=A0A9E7ISD1_9CAUD|nr:DNA helicase [Rhodococcus phage Mbo2]
MSLHNRGSLEPYLPDSIKFYEHQTEGIRRMAFLKNFLLADEMGLGKTVQSAAVYALDVFRDMGDTMCVVCPASLKGNWYDEMGKFTRIHREILDGTPKKRSEQIEEFRQRPGAKILIVNYEQVVGHLRELVRCNFHVSLYDEAHYLKNPKAKRTAACHQFMTTRRFLLTGSPLLNHVNELWSLLEMIEPGEWGKYYQFCNRYCVYGGYKDKQIVGVKNEKELTARLQNVMIRRLKKDVLDLPPVQYVERPVDLHPNQKKYYDEVFGELKLTIAGQDTVEIQNALTKFLRLKQICGTTASINPDAPDDDYSTKLDIATNDADQILGSGHKIVAFTQFRSVQDSYRKRILNIKRANKKGKMEAAYEVFILNGDTPTDRRQEVVRQWANFNAKPAILICMYQVAGVGLNMTEASHMQRLDRLFVPELNAQAVARLDRIGQKNTVQVFDYIVRKTVEARVEKIVAQKKSVFENIVERDNWQAAVIAAAMEEDEQRGNAA